jgi:hypothetical protein
VAIVGGAALLCGLVLLGLPHSILRLYEGYPLKNAKRPPLTWLARPLLWFQRWRPGRANTAQRRRRSASTGTIEQQLGHDPPRVR